MRSEPLRVRGWRLASRLSVAAVLWVAVGALGCGDDSSADDVGAATSDAQLWECVEARDGWEQCDGTSVIWCHAVAHGPYGSGHFHEGANCADTDTACVTLDDQTAACADAAAPCEAGFAECNDRDALNCVDGMTATMRCSLAEACAVMDEGARCVPK